MEKSKLLNAERRELLAKYPLYSQDGKKGEAVALFRLFLTGTAAVWYILEGEPCGEYEGRENWELYGVSNLEREGWRFGYFSLSEIEGLNLYGGLVHAEADAEFTPTPLREIAEAWPDIDAIVNRKEE